MSVYIKTRFYNMNSNFDSAIQFVKEQLSKANNIGVITGAGTSTASGIQDFRGDNGIYNQDNSDLKYKPEEILSIDFFDKDDEHKKIFWQFYRKYFTKEYEPNIAHNFFANLEKAGKEVHITTQNIDSLHAKAGSKNVYEIHGNASKFKCMCCEKEFGTDWFSPNTDEIPVHKDCVNIILDETPYIRPEVVLYGEMLPSKEIHSANISAQKADIYFVVGTSLDVGPANGLPTEYIRSRRLCGRHSTLVIINKGYINAFLLEAYKRTATNLIYFNQDMTEVFKALER